MLRCSRMWLRMNLNSSRRCGDNGGRGGSMTGRGGGWLAKRSIVSNEDYGVGGPWWEIHDEVIGEGGGDTIGIDGGVVNFYGLATGNRLNVERKLGFIVYNSLYIVHLAASSAISICKMELAFVNEGNLLSVVDSKQWCLNEVKTLQKDV
ncbi:hypothetical protein Tco_0168488 [Tanacetum coccineum]